MEPAAVADPTLRPEVVVLLHGQGRTRASMWPLQLRLRRAGFVVYNFPYSSGRTTFDELSTGLRAYLGSRVAGHTYHFVAHSMGNVIVRDASRVPLPPGLGRIVMLAPPNGPAELAQRWRTRWWYQWWFGAPGARLGDPDFYAALPVPEVDIGVIAGTRAHTPFLAPEPSDGVVRVENTKVRGMTDWISGDLTHTFIMVSPWVARQTIAFLRDGRFE